MKFSIVGLIVAMLTQSVATAPSPDPGHLEVVLSLDDANAADQPLTAQTPTIKTPTPSQSLPSVQALFFSQVPSNGLPGSTPLPLDGKLQDLSQSSAYSQ